MASNPKVWASTYNQSNGRIIAAQHFCGPDGHAINARLDDADNWYCPRCGELYAAAEQMAAVMPMLKKAVQHAE
jgi:hypothetical protein